MKYPILFLIVLVNCFSVKAQNAVHNPGFEQYNICPTGISQFDLTHLVDWDKGTNGSSDFMNTCAPQATQAGIPTNYFGYQWPYEGNSYAGVHTYYQGIGVYREYLKGTLDPLVVGVTYNVSIRVCRTEAFRVATDGMGVFFYINNVAVNLVTTSVLNLVPQVDYSSYGPITDTMNWTVLQGTFTADSAYQHILIGNFKNDNNVIQVVSDSTGADAGYYLIDYVDISPANFIIQPTHTNVSCNGGANGTASVTPINGTPPYTYLWLPGNQTTQSVTGLAAGSYTVRAIDAAQDTARDTIIITEPPALTATTSQTNVSCNGGNNGTATVTVSGGTTPYTYSWAPTGGNAATATGLTAGSYTCTITDFNGCTLQKTFVITQSGSLVASTSQVNILCNGASTGSATVNASGGTTPYTYAWAPTGGNNPTASGLAAGNYTCTITDFNSCTLLKTFTLTQPTALTATTSQTNITCNGAANGTASVTVSGGVPGYVYSWAPSGGNAASASDLIPGTYTCTITDANNCTLQKTFTITQPAVLTATITHTDVTCHGAGNGTATVVVTGGTIPYSYSWLPSGGNSATANGLVPGTYTCNITDANGCTTSQSATITEPATNLSVIPVQTNILCNGANTGIASVIASGGTVPYTYSWAPTGGNGSSAYNLVAGTYTCTITDAHNCNTTQAFTITEAPAIVATTSHADLLCHGDNNGIATVLVSGGTPPYAYSWAPTGGNGPNATGLLAGTYICTITDHNNCIHNETVVINEAAQITSVDSQSDLKCYNDGNGYAQVIVSGGTAPYTYLWAPAGGNGNAASGLSAGSYTCIIKDYNNCILNESFNITQPEQLSAHTSKTNVVCQNLNQGVAIAVATGGIAPYTYLWTPGNTTDTIITGLGVSKDTCLITDANGCTYNVAFNIVDTSQPFSYSITDSAIDCRSAWLNAIPATGSSTAVTYLWLFGDSSSATVNPLMHTFPQSGNNSTALVIVNAVGCHDTLSHAFNINKPMLADFTTEPEVPLPNAPVQFNNASSMFATIFKWDFGDGSTSTEESPLKSYNDSGSFHICLVASDANNCVDTVCKDISISTEKVVAVPSAFSPNGDGENDVLYIRGYRLSKVKLRIYNRWGNLVFETDTKEKGWDGTYKGQPQTEEAYAYTLEATFTDGSTKQITGSITLLR